MERNTDEMAYVCQKLIDILDAYEGRNEMISNQGQALDGYSALHNFVSIARYARKILQKDG